MKIVVADYSGFCFGVKNAVSTAYNAAALADSSEGNVYTYGPIIHNRQVVEELEHRGVRQLPSIDDLKDPDTVIIRSHGVSESVIEELKDKKVKIIDATCPYVDYIHKKVNEYYKKGYQIIIIGNPKHPEVKGINGWCNNTSIIIEKEEDVDVLKKYPKLCVVAQTTTNINKWKGIILSLLDLSKELAIFNTICSATEQRQKSAEELAKKCDAVIVLGGYNSSNTKKLVEICNLYCKNTIHAENINEIDISRVGNVNTLGIIAGASTPDCIIKEAINKMSISMDNIETNNNLEGNNEQERLINEYEKTLVRLHDGDIVKGKIIYVTDDEATIDLGYKTDGIITKEELSIEGDISPKELLKPGDEVEVYIIKVNDGEGNVLASKKKVDAERNIEYIEDVFKSQEVVEAKVIAAVKGGLSTEVKGVRVFIPASLVDNRYVEDLSKFVKTTIEIKIIECDMSKRKIIGSRKVVIGEELAKKKKNILENTLPGQILTGKVSRITNFGAFVDLDGIDGLIHISELSWARIKHPSEVVKEGDMVEVYVLQVDKESGKISLSLKKTVEDPWINIQNTVHADNIVEGTVVRIAPFGAFVEIVPGVDGLVHISQISEKRVNKVEDELKVGDKIKAKVMELNVEDKKISLSIKEAVEDKNREENKEVLKNQEEEKITVADILGKNDLGKNDAE